jgi:hypothetical protein
MSNERELLALKSPSGVFRNFFPNKVCMSMCGPPPYHRVRLTLDPAGEYWAWHDFEDGDYHFTNHSRMGVEICFPSGSEAEATLGRGKIVRVRVEELGVAG